MSVTSTIQLNPIRLKTQPQTYPSTRPREDPDSGPTFLNDDEPDPVLAASRVADSTVPDGGYGWAIVGGCATLMWWAAGTAYSWGVIQEALVSQGLSTPAVLSFIGSLSATLISALGVVNSKVTRLLGARRTGMVGVAFMGGSEILSSFATRNVGAMFFTSGFLFGIGISLSFMVVTAVPPQYFSRRRGLANGLIFAGGGFGGAAISFGVDALIRELGVPWAYRILGITTLLTGLPGAWFIKERMPTQPQVFIEWQLFKSLTFVLVFFVGAIGTFPLFVPPFFLPLYCDALGFGSRTGAGLVAGFNLASAVGRIGSGMLCDGIGSVNTLFISLALTALSMLALWPASTTLTPMIIFVLVNGMANGAFFSTMPTVVSNVFGSARMSIAMGMIVTGWVGGYLLGAPIAGYLLEAYGGTEKGFTAYRPAMFYAGSMALGAAGLVVLLRFRKMPGLWVKM